MNIRTQHVEFGTRGEKVQSYELFVGGGVLQDQRVGITPTLGEAKFLWSNKRVTIIKLY